MFFLWVYYGYPSAYYEGINVEDARYRCGAAMAKRDELTPDFAAGIPDWVWDMLSDIPTRRGFLIKDLL